MQIEEEKAAKIQELLKKLAESDAFEAAAISKEIKLIATESPSLDHRVTSSGPVAINTINE